MEAPGSLPRQRGCPLPSWVTGPHPHGCCSHPRLQGGEASSLERWGGGSPAGRQNACLWFLGNTVEICSIFKILVFPPATHTPFTPLLTHPPVWVFAYLVFSRTISM